MGINAEVNRRDWLGRTVLHRAVSEMEWKGAAEWVEMLVAFGGTGVNLQDRESGWGALHR